MRKKIIVTGGLGFIGSHTVVELLNQNYEVIVIDNLSNSEITIIKGIEKITSKNFIYCKLDLKDKKNTIAFFEKYKKSLFGIIHFAAYKYVGESVNNPLKYYENNIVSLTNVLEAIKLFSLKINFVFSSSCTVYGETKNSPINENESLAVPQSPYGNTKQISEEILFDFSKSYQNIKINSLRYFNPIGAHQSSEIGELPLGKPQNLVPLINQVASGLLDELVIHGNDYNTKDGTCVRDYIDVVDLAKAHIASLQYLKLSNTNKKYEVFNLGSGEGHSVLEVIKKFEKVNNLKVNYRFGKRRSGDVESIFSDSRKAKLKLKWQTDVNLEESLLNSWNWQQRIKNKNI